MCSIQILYQLYISLSQVPDLVVLLFVRDWTAADEKDSLWYACRYTSHPQQGQTLGLGYL